MTADRRSKAAGNSRFRWFPQYVTNTYISYVTGSLSDSPRPPRHNFRSAWDCMHGLWAGISIAVKDTDIGPGPSSTVPHARRPTHRPYDPDAKAEVHVGGGRGGGVHHLLAGRPERWAAQCGACLPELCSHVHGVDPREFIRTAAPPCLAAVGGWICRPPILPAPPSDPSPSLKREF